MVIVNSVKGDEFEQSLQSRDVKEFVTVILNYKDDVVKDDFILNFHGVSFTTEGCEFTNDFINKNRDALLKLDEILEQEEKKEKEATTNALDGYLSDYANGIRDFNLQTRSFELNNSEGFIAEIDKLRIEIENIKNSTDISSLDLNEKEEKAKEAVDNALAIPDFNTVKEAILIVDKLEESDAKKALLTSIVSFIKNNINTIEEKDELNKIIEKYPIESIEDLQNKIEKINNEIKIRKQQVERFRKSFTKSKTAIKKEVELSKKSEEVNESPKKEIEEKESNQEFITKLESIAKDGQIFQDLDLTTGYSYGAYKAVSDKKAESKPAGTVGDKADDIEEFIPDVDKEVLSVIKNKVRKIKNISKAPIALIEKVRNIDFKSKVNKGLEKIKELASKVSEYNSNLITKVSDYNNKLVTEYYTKRLERANEQEEKYAKKIEEMASKSSDPDLAVGMSR